MDTLAESLLQYSAMPNCQSLHHLHLCIVWWQANSLCFRFDMGRSLDSIGSIGYWMILDGSIYTYQQKLPTFPTETEAMQLLQSHGPQMRSQPWSSARCLLQSPPRRQQSGMNSSDCARNMQVDFKLSESYIIYYI